MSWLLCLRLRVYSNKWLPQGEPDMAEQIPTHDPEPMRLHGDGRGFMSESGVVPRQELHPAARPEVDWSSLQPCHRHLHATWNFNLKHRGVHATGGSFMSSARIRNLSHTNVQQQSFSFEKKSGLRCAVVFVSRVLRMN